MKINREMLTQMANMSDADLWRQICDVAGKHGYVLSKSQPPHTEMEKLRSLMRGDTQISPSDAMRLLNEYKSKR